MPLPPRPHLDVLGYIISVRYIPDACERGGGAELTTEGGQPRVHTASGHDEPLRGVAARAVATSGIPNHPLQGPGAIPGSSGARPYMSA